MKKRKIAKKGQYVVRIKDIYSNNIIYKGIIDDKKINMLLELEKLKRGEK